MDKITESREATQPIKSRTGGSTFKNPPGHKAWQLIDAAGCRGLIVGGAQVSELHCNFLINLGSATAADIETLGETVRKRVKENSGVDARMGDQADRRRRGLSPGRASESFLSRSELRSRQFRRAGFTFAHSGLACLLIRGAAVTRKTIPSSSSAAASAGPPPRLRSARKGYRVRVLEQAPEFGVIGYGIQLGPNVFPMFDRLGVSDAVLAQSIVPKARADDRLGRWRRDRARADRRVVREAVQAALHRHPSRRSASRPARRLRAPTPMSN